MIEQNTHKSHPIDTSDVELPQEFEQFVEQMSENAAQSEYVKKERMQALERAYPKVQDGNLSICPMSIEPRAELPSDMKDDYHFGEI